MILGRTWSGARRHAHSDESKAQTLAVQGSLLAILGLLLGFTFSLALGRFDARSQAVVDEANAIGTAWLRVQLLPEDVQPEARNLLIQYARLRAQAGEVPASNVKRRAGLVTLAETTFDQLWTLSAKTARDAGGPVALSFTSSLNDMIDQLSARDAAIERHVPEPVLFLLYGTFIILGLVLGIGSGESGVKPGLPIYAMLVLIVALVFIIIDLDRPRRGIIAVDQAPIRKLADSMGEPG
ncbi:hypothetical protein [Thioclava pacifica]|nr:hypothetical protein [Thioclava pacifica]